MVTLMFKMQVATFSAIVENEALSVAQLIPDSAPESWKCTNQK